jgi:exopolyphosphatase/guanosine-5'-triphosphate,3'-diphosphate pyrophosphatase
MPDYLKKQNSINTIAAIDLGSNALRAVIARRRGDTLEVIKSFREPLRLGEDVFSSGEICLEKMIRTEEAFIKLFHLFTEYNVIDVRALSTSAMRDAKNGQTLIKRIADSTGIELFIINGKEEANLITLAVQGQLNLKTKTALIMDIGGGSTELIIIKRNQIIAVESFDIGTIRLLGLDHLKMEEEIKIFIHHMTEFIKNHIRLKDIDLFAGTGGNLRRIGKIRKKILRKPSSQIANFNEIHQMEQTLLSMNYVDRLKKLELDHHRADVLFPALMITHHLMERLKIEKIHLPKVGLKEGIILSKQTNLPKRLIIRD